MDEKAKQQLIELFNQGFEEVVLPQIENLRTEFRLGFKKLNGRLTGLESRLDSFAGTIRDQDNRIRAIESVPAIAHAIKK